MNVAFLGTPPFAAASLTALAGAGHRICCVVAQPDRPAGRGQSLREPATKTWARSHGVPVFQPEKVRDGKLAGALAALRPDVLVVVAFGRILGRDLLELAPHGAVNVHASLLPRWRGAAPIQWAIAAGDAWTGISIMRLDEGLDTGPVLMQRATPIGPDDTAESLSARLAVMGGAALCEVLPLLESGRAVPVTQDPALATAAPIIERGHGRLDFQQPAHALACRVRAFTPWPGAFTTLNGKLLKVHGARALGPGELLEGAGAARAPRRSETLALGEAVGTTAGIAVGCAEGTALLLLELQLEGKKRLRAAEFLKGVALPPGTVLGT